jgi:hypothetical protein
MLLGPFVSAVFASVCVLELLYVNDDWFTALALLEKKRYWRPRVHTTHETTRPYSNGACCSSRLSVETLKLLVHKFDVESPPAPRTVSKELHLRSRLILTRLIWLRPLNPGCLFEGVGISRSITHKRVECSANQHCQVARFAASSR